MDLTLTVKLFGQILEAENPNHLIALSQVVQEAILDKTITSETDGMLLNLAIQNRTLKFQLESLQEAGAGSTVIIMGEGNEEMLQQLLDPEGNLEENLVEEELQKDLDEVKQGVVHSLKIVKDSLKKDDE
jgi:NDP-sugar pyrophosphorylase family protein